MAEKSPVDMATHPYLSGRFAPVHDEIEVDQLEVEGTLPDGLGRCLPAQRAEPEMFPPLGELHVPDGGRRHGARRVARR